MWPDRCTSAHAISAGGAPPLEFDFPAPYTEARALHDHAVISKHQLAPSIVKEREWAPPGSNHWHAFFKGSTGLFGGRERCDCSAGASGGSNGNGSTRTRVIAAREFSVDGRPVRWGHSCGRHNERRFYSRRSVEGDEALDEVAAETEASPRASAGRARSRANVTMSYIVSDCSGACVAWSSRCGRCWRDAGLEKSSQQWLVLNQGGLQAGWFHPPYCYTDVVESASGYLRQGGRGFWQTTNCTSAALLACVLPCRSLAIPHDCLSPLPLTSASHPLPLTPCLVLTLTPRGSSARHHRAQQGLPARPDRRVHSPQPKGEPRGPRGCGECNALGARCALRREESDAVGCARPLRA